MARECLFSMQELPLMADILVDPAAPAAQEAPPAVTHVDALPAGTRLAEFEIQGLLGVGGFGLVYRAYDHSLHRTVAIKEYMPAALAGRLHGTTVSVRSSSDEAGYQTGLQSFVAEARLLAQFDHPSLVKVYRFWEANNTAYMVMPLYRGVTLKQARSQMSSPPPEEWLRTVLWSILQALHVLHRSDTLHRDVSPDNIFLQDVGPPVLLDLGASRRAIRDKSYKMTAVLKVNFAPIEQYAEVEDLKQGPWTDLYALAAVVYTMLRNDPPPPATVRVVRDSMPSVRSVAATVKEHFGLDYSDRFVRAIGHALAVQPADRPQSLAAFVTEMKLKAPPRLSKFDWRAELGASLRAEEEGNSRQFEDTRAQTTPLAALGPEYRSKPRGWMGGVLRHGLGMRGLAVAGGGLLLTVVLAWDWLTVSQLIAPPEPAALPAPVVLQPEGGDDLRVERVSAGATADVPADSSPAVPEAESPAPQTIPVPQAAPPLQAVAAQPVEPANKTPEAPARKPVPKPKPAPKPASPPVPAATAPVARAPEKPADPPPRPLCPDANFFTRPMCIHLECQKAENANRPVCIENRRRYPEGGRSPGS